MPTTQRLGVALVAACLSLLLARTTGAEADAVTHAWVASLGTQLQYTRARMHQLFKMPTAGQVLNSLPVRQSNSCRQARAVYPVRFCIDDTNTVFVYTSATTGAVGVNSIGI